MSLPEDYKPCRHCGQLTDSGVCSSECARALDVAKGHKCWMCDEPCGCDEMNADCEACALCQSVSDDDVPDGGEAA